MASCLTTNVIQEFVGNPADQNLRYVVAHTRECTPCRLRVVEACAGATASRNDERRRRGCPPVATMTHFVIQPTAYAHEFAAAMSRHTHDCRQCAGEKSYLERVVDPMAGQSTET